MYQKLDLLMSHLFMHPQEYRRMLTYWKRSGFQLDRLKYLMRSASHSLPLKIGIEMSTGCNRSCVYCPVGTSERDVHRMPFPKFQSLIDELDELGFVGRLSYHRFNEPLLDQRLNKFVSYANEKLPGSKHLISTNGDYLDSETLVELCDAGMDKIIISQHYVAPEQEDEDWVQASDKRIRSIVDSADDTLANCEEIHRETDGLAVTGESNYRLEFTDRQDLVIGFRKISGNYDELTNRGGTVHVLKDEEHRGCPYFAGESADGMNIHPNGDVLLCCHQFSPDFGPVFGNVFEESIFDVWTDPEFVAVREELRNDDADRYEMCRNCKFGEFDPEAVEIDESGEITMSAD